MYHHLDTGFRFATINAALEAAEWGIFAGTSVRLLRRGHQDTILCKRADGVWYTHYLGQPVK